MRRLYTRLARSTLAGNTFYVLAAQLLSKGVLYGVTLLVAQFLSSTDFASFNYFLLTSGLLSAYLGLGLPLAAFKLISGDGPGSTERRQAAVQTLTAIALTSALIGLLAAPLYLPLLNSDELPLPGWWIVVGAIGGALATLAQASLMAIGKFKQALPATALGSLVFIAGAVAAATSGLLEALLIGTIAGAVVTTAGSAVLLHKDGVLLPPRRWARVRLPQIKAVLAVALPGLGLSVVSATWTWLIARSLLENHAEVEQLSMFAIGIQWLGLLMLLPSAASMAALPGWVRVAEVDDRVSRRASLIPALLFAAMFLFASPLAPFAAPILTWIYGGGLVFSSWLVFAVLMSAAVNGPQGILAQAIIAERGAGTWLVVNLIALATCVVLLHLVPPRSAVAAFTIFVATMSVMLLGALLLQLGLRSGPAPSRPDGVSEGS